MTLAELQELVALRKKAHIAWGKWSRNKDSAALDRYFEYCERLLIVVPQLRATI